MTVTPAEMAAYVEQRYRQGWRMLKVTHEDRVVAEIKRGYYTGGRRIWYAETAA